MALIKKLKMNDIKLNQKKDSLLNIFLDHTKNQVAIVHVAQPGYFEKLLLYIFFSNDIVATSLQNYIRYVFERRII